jgi:hypothetical protein
MASAFIAGLIGGYVSAGLYWLFSRRDASLLDGSPERPPCPACPEGKKSCPLCWCGL